MSFIHSILYVFYCFVYFLFRSVITSYMHIPHVYLHLPIVYIVPTYVLRTRTRFSPLVVLRSRVQQSHAAMSGSRSVSVPFITCHSDSLTHKFCHPSSITPPSHFLSRPPLPESRFPTPLPPFVGQSRAYKDTLCIFRRRPQQFTSALRQHAAPGK
ncbi:hypothetical protein BDN71DRAFT_773431 [Pleurotus eryngii]|uniref:Uncharacterized protein n=1 Tax=Pleurotus eryngii TaxID=5323 RepID=A0A9P6D7V9_PLEER|nr:hypothetical protein BDN71DRAFT_773431 [Pleurotus eryngii]